jgi:hypothetical protein
MLTFEERVLSGNPLQRFGFGLELDPEPTWEFGPVANTSPILKIGVNGALMIFGLASWLMYVLICGNNSCMK